MCGPTGDHMPTPIMRSNRRRVAGARGTAPSEKTIRTLFGSLEPRLRQPLAAEVKPLPSSQMRLTDLAGQILELEIVGYQFSDESSREATRERAAKHGVT